MRLFKEDRLDLSEPLLRKLIAEREKVDGPRHPRTVGLLPLHATILWQLKRYAEAEAVIRRFIAAPADVRRRSGTADEMAGLSLGSILVDQKRDREAEPVLRSSLDSAERGYGVDDGVALNLRAALAALNMRRARYAEAVAALETQVAARERVEGAEGDGTLRTLADLAEAYRGARLLDKEEATRLLLLERRRHRHYGDKHAQSINAMIALGQYYSRNGKPAEAAKHLTAALSAIDSAGLPQAYEVADLMAQAAKELALAGRTADADSLRRREQAARQRLAGANGAATLEAGEALASIYDTTSRDDEVAPLLRRLSRVRLADASWNRGAQWTLGKSYLAFREWSDAERYLRPLLEEMITAGNASSADLILLEESLVAIYEGQLRFVETEPLLVRLVDRLAARDGPKGDAALFYVRKLGTLYANQSRWKEAAPVLRRALEGLEARQDPDDADLWQAIDSLAKVERAAGNRSATVALYERSLRLKEKLYGAEDISTALALGNLAQAYRDAGRAQDAIALFRRAIELSQRRYPALATLLAPQLADMLVREGKAKEAETFLVEAIKSAPKDVDTDGIVGFLAGEVAHVLLVQPGRADRAIGSARMAAGSARDRRKIAQGDRYFAAGQDQRRQGDQVYFERLADAAWSSAQVKTEDLAKLRLEAFAGLQESMSGEADRAVAKMAARRNADQFSAGLGALAQERDVLTEQWRTLREREGASFTAIGTTAREERASLQQERSNVEKRLDAISERLKAEFPKYFALIEPQPLTLEDAQKLISPDEAILLVVPTEFGTHLMVVSTDGIDWQRSPLTAPQVNETVQRLRWDLGASVSASAEQVQRWKAEAFLSPRPAFDRVSAHRLYQQLLAPLAARWAGKRRLYVAAGGVLRGLPFSVFVTEAPTGADDDPAALRSTRWLGFDFGLTHIPSIQSLAQLRRSGAGRQNGKGFAGIGDPVLLGKAQSRGMTRGVARSAPPALFSQVSARSAGSGVADQKALRSLARLPGTARELESLRQAFGAPPGSLMLASRARESAVRAADLSDTAVLAFATHGITAQESSDIGEAGLVLTPPPAAGPDDDGYLAESEVAALRLNADWVILSACNTATGDGSEGLSGLARAFFYAGTRSMLASHWPVDDEVAPRLTVRTIELERQGLTRAESFQQAMREVRDDTSRDASSASRAHPYFWAPFVLLGDGGK